MIGYALISEEHPGSDLVRHARAAQDHGLEYLSVSDHFHPWTDTQGHSPFAWFALAAGGEHAARIAADLGAALVTTSPDEELISTYRDAGGPGPVYGQVTCCWAGSEDAGRETMHERWPQTVVGWAVSTELPTPAGFADASEHASIDDVVGSSPVGPDPEPYVESVGAYLDAGSDHVALHQVGADQIGFLAFAKGELLPRLRG